MPQVSDSTVGGDTAATSSTPLTLRRSGCGDYDRGFRADLGERFCSPGVHAVLIAAVILRLHGHRDDP